MLTLRDAQSSKTHLIPPSGAVIGRDGGEADITVSDKSVSKKHARIYSRNGQWFIEDLNSSNGTFIDDQRISAPMPLGRGTSFSLSNYQFEVVKIAGGDTVDDELGDDVGVRTRLGKSPDAPSAPPPRTRAPAEPVSPTAPRVNKPGPRAVPSRGGAAAALAPADEPEPEPEPQDVDMGMGGDPSLPAEKKSFGAGMAAIPKGIGYFMTTPLKLINFKGTTSEHIENPPLPAMTGFELGFFLMPAYATIVLASQLSARIMVFEVTHNIVSFLIGIVIAAVVGAIVGVIGAIITGFLVHPLGGWLIRVILRGDSNDLNRTNFVALTYAALLLVLPAQLLTGVAIASPLPVIGVVPLLASAVGTALLGYVTWQFWKNAFAVHKVWQIIAILMMFGGVPSLLSLPSLILHPIRSSGGGTSVTVPTMPPMGGITPIAHGTPAMPHATPELSTMTTPVRPAATPTRMAMNTPVQPAATPMTGGNGNAHPGSMIDDGNSSQPQTEYMRYVAKRDAVEKAIDNDPTILKRDATTLQLYTKLHAIESSVAKKYAARGHDAVVQHLIEADTFEQSAGVVQQLYDHLGLGR